MDQFSSDPPEIGASELRRVLTAAAAETGLRLQELCPLSQYHDAFLQDTPTNHINAQWFAGAVGALIRPGARFHLRGLHYRLVSVPGGYPMPGRRAIGARREAFEGMTYKNDPESFSFLVDRASKAARWLQYIPWHRIVDERNDAPEIFVPEAGRIEKGVAFGGYVSVPDLQEALPSVVAGGFKGRQPYRLIIIGEKSSLSDEVRPIAVEHGAEMILFTGNASLSLVAEMVERAAYDGRPAAVFYLSDFDPAGAHMATAVARAIQAHCVGSYPGLDIVLYPVALNYQQCVDDDGLPSTPLSDGELRGSDWRALYGREQTEIDALLAIHPGRLGNILTDAIAPFYDRTLARRAMQAERAWIRRATEVLRGHPRWEAVERDIAAEVDALQEAAARLEEAQDRARDLMADIALPAAKQIEPEIATVPLPVPLFDSKLDFATQSQKLVRRKKLLGDDVELQKNRQGQGKRRPKHREADE